MSSLTHGEQGASHLEILFPEEQAWIQSGRRRKHTPVPRPDVSHLQLAGQVDEGWAYASASVLAEAKKLRADGFRYRDYVYHATNSSALASIALHGALLSSKALIEANQPITSGEIISDAGKYQLSQGGLDDIYASDCPIDTTYAQRTEQHHAVIFGIDPHTLNRQPDTNIGDGRRLGGRVALRSVIAQIVPFDQIDAAKQWASEAGQHHIQTLSWEATSLLYEGLGYDR